MRKDKMQEHLKTVHGKEGGRKKRKRSESNEEEGGDNFDEDFSYERASSKRRV
jgi:hypothetical protein